MLEFKAPLKDIRFLLYDVFDYPTHYRHFPMADGSVDAELIDSILESASEFGEKVLFPLYASADKEGCHLVDGEVTTPKGFKEAYAEFIAGGWTTLSGDPAYGGQGLPHSLSAVFSEIIGTSNWSFGMYPGRTHGAINTIEMHGTDQQKQCYLPALISGVWAGTMCLTEAHCGSDLGQLRTRAVPLADGSYKINGSKIFISSGDHDLTENIVHIVLARLPDAPEGTKGISLFIVPKFMVNADGSLGERNAVVTGSLEEKMGIKGSSTAVLNFDDAVGYLIGPPNRGLNCMFTFINTSRIGNAIQGVAAAELSYQGARKYARERLAMRSLSGVKAPELPADPILVHPDVRKMLLIQRSIAEGGRAMIYQTGKIVDFMSHAKTEEERKTADKRLGLLTPILKGFLTELGCEAASHGMQVYGGHGYIKEMGMEQILRDVRIATIYEGTTQIQALDLLGRKVLLDRCRELDDYIAEIKEFCSRYGTFTTGFVGLRMKRYTRPLTNLLRQWKWNTRRLMFGAARNRDVVGSAAVDYLMYSGYIVMAYAWAQIAEAALIKLERGDGDAEYLKGKIQTARFYYQRMLPRTVMHHRCMIAPPESVTAIHDAGF